MDFSAIFQLRTKRFWWMDIIFYFVISLLIATIFLYGVFLIKNSIQREDIKTETEKLKTLGTDQQKEYEKQVIMYQKKVGDFASLLENHQFASNTFALIQEKTRPNIWFSQFALDRKSDNLKLSGESNDMDSLSRQVAVFDKNEYVGNINSLSSNIGDSGRIKFDIDLSMDKKIFSYLYKPTPVLETETPLNQEAAQNQEESQENSSSTSSTVNQENNQPDQNEVKSSQKLITSFHLLTDPEVIGLIDEKNYIINLAVPYGTNLKNLTPAIVVSSKATIIPSSNVMQDFSSPVTYRVMAEDGSLQNYVATVDVAPQQAKKFNFSNIIVEIILTVIGIAAIAVIIFLAIKKMKKPKEAY